MTVQLRTQGCLVYDLIKTAAKKKKRFDMKEICFEYEILHQSLDDRDDTALQYVS